MLLFQAEKQSLEQNLQKTEENLSRQLTYAQQVSLLCSSRSHSPVSMETFPRFHMHHQNHGQHPHEEDVFCPPSWQDRRLQAELFCIRCFLASEFCVSEFLF